MRKADQIKLEQIRILEHIHAEEPRNLYEMACKLKLSRWTAQRRVRDLNDDRAWPDVGRTSGEGRTSGQDGWRWRTSLNDPTVHNANHRHVYTINEGTGHKMDRQVSGAAVSQPEVVPEMLNRMDGATPNEIRPGVSDAVRELRATPSGCRELSKWKTGNDPVTPRQLSYLKALANHAGVAVPPAHTKWEAHKAISDLESLKEQAA